MSELNITYYKNREEIKASMTEDAQSDCVLSFNIADRNSFEEYKLPDEKRVSYNGFKVIITENDNLFSEISYPPTGITFNSSDQFNIFSEKLDCDVDDKINFVVKIGTLKNEFSFTIPKPTKPFESWSWKDGRWTPPVAYPDAAREYNWNEEKLNWELI
jgi:hypothetical protein